MARDLKLPRTNNGGYVQLMQDSTVAPEHLTISATATNNVTAFTEGVVELHPEMDCCIAWGTGASATPATTSSRFLKGGVTRQFSLGGLDDANRPQVKWVSVIASGTVSGTPKLHIQQMR